MEEKSPRSNALLHFPDGSTRGITVRDLLGLTLASMDRASARCEGQSVPKSKFDPILNLLATCSEIESNEPLFEVVKGTLDWAKDVEAPIRWKD